MRRGDGKGSPKRDMVVNGMLAFNDIEMECCHSIDLHLQALEYSKEREKAQTLDSNMWG